MTCPANTANTAESGQPTGLPSQEPDFAANLILQSLSALIASQAKLTEAMHAYAQSNHALSEAIVQALAEDQGMEETPTGQYMDGSPVR